MAISESDSSVSAVPRGARRLWAGRVHFRIDSAEATFGQPTGTPADEETGAASGSTNGRKIHRNGGQSTESGQSVDE
jgi:hypothetical protein